MNNYVRIEYNPASKQLHIADPDTQVSNGHEVIARTAYPKDAAEFAEQIKTFLPNNLPAHKIRTMFSNYQVFGRVGYL